MSRVFLKTTEEIELVRQSCLLVSETLAYVANLVKPGVTGKFLDKEAEHFIRDHAGIPGFLGYGGFPGTLCISLNEVVVHGIPNDYELTDGDIISVDCGVQKEGFFGDSAYTFAVGEISDMVMNLLKVTNESLYLGIREAVVGNRVEDIGFAIQHYTERVHGYGVVRELVGHGVGRNLHEGPEVPNFGKRGRGMKLVEGMVIAIEPMINLGKKNVVKGDDGWTIRTKDRTPSAHFEHTIAVTVNGPQILSDHKIVEESVDKNPNLTNIKNKN